MWKDIPQWEELYEVNDKGEVRNKKTSHLLIGDKNNAGYCRICLYNRNIKQRFFRHRLVAELFIENPNHYTEVNHKDGDKENNNATNLEWCDRQMNERAAHCLGIKDFRPFYVIFCDGSKKDYEFAIDLANELNLTKRAIQNYLQGKSQGYKNYGIQAIEYIKPNDYPSWE